MNDIFEKKCILFFFLDYKIVIMNNVFSIIKYVFIRIMYMLVRNDNFCIDNNYLSIRKLKILIFYLKKNCNVYL